MAANSRRQRLDLHRRIFIRIFEKIEPEIIAFEFVCVCVCVCVCPLICVFVLLQSTNGTTSTCRSERGLNFLLESEEFFGRQVTTGRKQLRRPCGSHESSGTDGVLQKKKEPKKGKKRFPVRLSGVRCSSIRQYTHTHPSVDLLSILFLFAFGFSSTSWRTGCAPDHLSGLVNFVCLRNQAHLQRRVKPSKTR